MLSTLFKHEMRATAKTFIWLYVAFAVIAVVNVIANPYAMTVSEGSSFGSAAAPTNVFPGMMQGLTAILYGLSVAAMIVGTFVVVILRFFRNLLGDEGYLMMTLPVSREENILSKLLVAVVWNICTGVLIFLSVLMMIGASGYFGDMIQGMNEIIAMGVPLPRIIFQVVLLMIISTFSGVLMLYAAMGIGPNMIKNRIGGSILAFVIIYVASQFVMLGVMWGVAHTYFAGGLMGQLRDSVAMSAEKSISNTVAVIDSVTIGCIIGYAVIGVVCWFLTRYMLKRKLNLA